jgi:branched-chain amino acid transport system ATP-binding protein
MRERMRHARPGSPPESAYLDAPLAARAPATPPLLEARGITVTYGQIAAVRNLWLTVGEGEVVALLGANGAGKTTTLRAISGMLRPRAGEVRFAGQRIDRRSPERIARLGVAHLPEGRGMFPRLSVSENLRMAGYGVGLSVQAYQEGLARALDLFPVLGERMGQLAGTLSGGQQQMLAVARALVTQPRLLMIDELSFGLAPGVVKQLFALLPAIAQRGTAILLVEQFVGQALAVASRAYVLEKGELTFDGLAADLAKQEGFVESSYLGAGAQRPDYVRKRGVETEMLRVRVDPALIRQLRNASGGKSLSQITSEALRAYVAERERRGAYAESATWQPGSSPVQRGEGQPGYSEAYEYEWEGDTE